MSNDLVSVIMLSRDKGKYVEESVRSVFAQTYQNWELIFMDDSSKDDTVSQMMDLMNERRVRNANGTLDSKVKVSRSVQERGFGVSVNSALRDAMGRWIAFLNVGDVWEPHKLEHQIAFMEENGYAFSYTKFGVIDDQGVDRGVVIGGKEHITYKEMQKCCWPGYLTVMYDASQVGKMYVRNIGRNNDYALWLNVCEKTDCHLLPECLAKHRTPWGLFGRLVLTDKLKWRYECYRVEEDLSLFKSVLYTVRNCLYGILKWIKYVERK